MKINELNNEYTAVIGLGYWCDVAGHLKNHNLRTFSGPFDWVLTPSLSDINRVLEARFEGYMDMNNLEFIAHGEIALDDNDQVMDSVHRTNIIRDKYYRITSVHDFPLQQGQDWKVDYLSFKAKLERRINRFLDICRSASSLLFIRLEATIEETIRLYEILSGLCGGQVHLLTINTVEGLNHLRENDLGIEGNVFMEIPLISSGNFHNLADVKHSNPHDWDLILRNIKVT